MKEIPVREKQEPGWVEDANQLADLISGCLQSFPPWVALAAVALTLGKTFRNLGVEKDEINAVRTAVIVEKLSQACYEERIIECAFAVSALIRVWAADMEAAYVDAPQEEGGA